MQISRNVQERKAEDANSGPSQADVDAASKKMLRYRELLKISEQDALLAQVSRNHEFCIKNEEFCIKNEEFCRNV